MKLVLAPLRGVTVRTFRRVFAPALVEAGFTEAVSPFIPALNAKVNPRSLKDVEVLESPIPCVPQAIGKDPVALGALLAAFRDLGHRTADLNAGCPYPMIARKGRGSGLLDDPDNLARMLEAGVETMGPGNFSLKTRLGRDDPDTLLRLMPLLNRFPLRCLCVHARTARRMYEGPVDLARFALVAEASVNPVVYNGDWDPALGRPTTGEGRESFDVSKLAGVMAGRIFIRDLAARPDADELIAKYVAETETELCGRSSTLGRVKELLAYWSEATPRWRRRWESVKMCRTVAELKLVLGTGSGER